MFLLLFPYLLASFGIVFFWILLQFAFKWALIIGVCIFCGSWLLTKFSNIINNKNEKTLKDDICDNIFDGVYRNEDGLEFYKSKKDFYNNK